MGLGGVWGVKVGYGGGQGMGRCWFVPHNLAFMGSGVNEVVGG